MIRIRSIPALQHHLHRYYPCDIPTVTGTSTGLMRSASAAAWQRRSYTGSVIPSWATFVPNLLGTTPTPYAVQNLVNGVWQSDNTQVDQQIHVPHPYNTDVPYPIFTVPNTTNIQPFVESLRSCPKTGLHNPYKNVERYVQYGEISRKVRLVCQRIIVAFELPVARDSYKQTNKQTNRPRL